ncbi:MAG: energy transducer TonB [Pseudomonadales bacterium]
MATLNAAITPGDRLSFTTFLAVIIHAALILGVTFTYITNKPSTHTMEVTLAQHRSNNRPDKADFLAQFNQIGSGTLDKKALITSPYQADFHDTVIRETSPQQRPEIARKIVEKQKPVITTISSSKQQVVANTRLETPNEGKPISPVEKSLLQRSLEIASLEARLDRQRQIYAKRPRIKRLTSLSTASSADAYYLNSWRRKIESVGNLNYPEEARRRKLYGNLRLLVAILPDGSLREVSLLETSGHKVLDDAAIRIVQLSAPYAPFSDELRRTTDVLEIIRTWQFRKNSSLRSY